MVAGLRDQLERRQPLEERRVEARALAQGDQHGIVFKLLQGSDFSVKTSTVVRPRRRAMEGSASKTRW